MDSTVDKYKTLTANAIGLLEQLIASPSASKSENGTAAILESWFAAKGIATIRIGNNVIAEHRSSVSDAPVLLLNSHHDTVMPGSGWNTNPYQPTWDADVLYGLGSNDAGGALVTMASAFVHLAAIPNLSHHIVFAGTAEEEISGSGGMALLTAEYFGSSSYNMPIPALALVGEPTGMDMAIAEKGLLVLDCTVHGRTGHAARSEGLSAIYEALPAIEWFRTYCYPKTSAMLGSVKQTVTQIMSGAQHNVIPDVCTFVVDVRVTDCYTNQEIVDIVRTHVQCSVVPRSMRLRPSGTPPDHPIVSIGQQLGRRTYGSPTLSDQSLLPDGVPSLKIGPGDSARSHTPNEYITHAEIHHGITTLIDLLERYLNEALG